MSAEWELETVALATEYRAMEVALIDEAGNLSGRTMPVIPVEFTQERLVVSIPHTYATWLPPVLLNLSDGDGVPSQDGNMVTGSFLVLGPDAAESLMPASGSSGWVEDGRWPLATSVWDAVSNIPDEITTRQIIMAGSRWHDGGLPATELTVSPNELDFSFHAGLNGGPWNGLLSLVWPIPEPLQEPPHDPTDADIEGPGVLGDSQPAVLPRPTPSCRPQVLPTQTKVAAGATTKKATTAQRLDSMHADMSQLTTQVAQLATLMSKMQSPVVTKSPAAESSNGGGRPPAPFPDVRGPPPRGYNPFQTSMVGPPPPGGPPPISGTPVWQGADSQLAQPPPGHIIGAGMMGPPMRNRVAQSGTSIFGQSPGSVPPDQDLRSMVASILAEVGVAPRALPGKATGSRPEDPISREQVRAMITDMVQSQSENQNMLTDGNEVDVSGARGAVAYAREKTKFENNPQLAYQDFRNKARRILGRGGSQPTTFKHLMTELPFGQMNNRKRMALLLLTMLDEVEVGNWAMVQGLMVQAMRWIVLDLENPRDPLTSWRLTFQPDPIPMQCPVRNAQGMDLNSSLLDPAQLTSTLGMARDMELLSKRLKGQKEEESPKRGKGKGGGKDKEQS